MPSRYIFIYRAKVLIKISYWGNRQPCRFHISKCLSILSRNDFLRYFYCAIALICTGRNGLRTIRLPCGIQKEWREYLFVRASVITSPAYTHFLFSILVVACYELLLIFTGANYFSSDNLHPVMHPVYQIFPNSRLSTVNYQMDTTHIGY